LGKYETSHDISDAKPLRLLSLQGNVSVVPGGISKDGRDSAVVHYNKTNAIFFRPLEDEMRRVSSHIPLSFSGFGYLYSQNYLKLPEEYDVERSVLDSRWLPWPLFAWSIFINPNVKSQIFYDGAY
jgi:hypothetical protein